MREALKEIAAAYTKPLLFSLAIHAIAVALWAVAWRWSLSTHLPGVPGQIESIVIFRGWLALLTLLIVALAARDHAGIGRIAVVADGLFFAGALVDSSAHLGRRANVAIPWIPPGLTLPIFIGICGLVLFFLLFSLVCLRLLQGVLELRARPLRRHLARRGYDWLTMEQARHLVAIAGNEAYRLPPWDQAGQIPGVNDQDMESLARLAAMVTR